MDLLSLLDDIVINEILAKLPLSGMASLCQSHSRFAAICAGERLWSVKTSREFAPMARFKPVYISWRNYYIFLLRSRRVPLYQNGDIVTLIPFDLKYFNLIVDMIVPHIDVLDSLHIVFINAQREPVFVVHYPSGTFIIENFGRVEKILLITHPEFGQANDNRIIYEELTSPLGSPPIYGTVQKGRFKLIDGTNSSFRSVGLDCETMSRGDLSQIAQALMIPHYMLMEADLRNAIRERLQEIGHII